MQIKKEAFVSILILISGLGVSQVDDIIKQLKEVMSIQKLEREVDFEISYEDFSNKINVTKDNETKYYSVDLDGKGQKEFVLSRADSSFVFVENEGVYETVLSLSGYVYAIKQNHILITSTSSDGMFRVLNNVSVDNRFGILTSVVSRIHKNTMFPDPNLESILFTSKDKFGLKLKPEKNAEVVYEHPNTALLNVLKDKKWGFCILKLELVRYKIGDVKIEKRHYEMGWVNIKKVKRKCSRKERRQMKKKEDCG